MQQESYLPGDEVALKDGRKGVLYALTQNSRNPLARDSRRSANWYFLPDRVGTQGMTAISQPCTVSALDIKRRTGHRAGSGQLPGMFLDLKKNSECTWLT